MSDPEWDIIPYQFQTTVNLFSTSGMEQIKDEKVYPSNYEDLSTKRETIVYKKRTSQLGGLPRNSASLDGMSPQLTDPLMSMPVSASAVYHRPNARPVSIAIVGEGRASEGSGRLKDDFMAGGLITEGIEEESKEGEDSFQVYEPQNDTPGWREGQVFMAEQQQQIGEGASASGMA